MTVIIIEINYVRANTREYGHVGVLIDSYNELEACNFIIPLQSTGMCASNLSISIPTNANTNTNTNTNTNKARCVSLIFFIRTPQIDYYFSIRCGTKSSMFVQKQFVQNFVYGPRALWPRKVSPFFLAHVVTRKPISRTRRYIF